jgi:hypothetical protein
MISILVTFVKLPRHAVFESFSFAWDAVLTLNMLRSRCNCSAHRVVIVFPRANFRFVIVALSIFQYPGIRANWRISRLTSFAVAFDLKPGVAGVFHILQYRRPTHGKGA